MVRDQETIESSIHNPPVSQDFVAPAQPVPRDLVYYGPAEATSRIRKNIESTEMPLREPAHFGVAPANTRQPEGRLDAQIYEPLRFAGAFATVTLREQQAADPAFVQSKQRVSEQQITPNIRVSHYTPPEFGADFEHALQIVDREVPVPMQDINPQHPMLKEYDPLEPLQSSEQQVVEASVGDDLETRDYLT